MSTTISCPQLLRHGRLGGPGAVTIEHGRIASVHEPPPPRADVELPGGVLTAGMVDLQLNGAAGVNLADADPAGWRRVAEHAAAHGVTAFSPTFITAELESLLAALDATVAARAALDGEAVAQPLAAHLEGPFLSPERPGAHPREHLREPTAAALDALLGAPAGAALGIVTVAPELRGALDAIDRLRAAGVTVALGHSQASAEQTARAADHGARLVTHLFNAQGSFSHREPGLAGRALVDERLVCGLIVDLFHVAPDAVRLAFTAAPGRIALVSDAVAAAGMPPGPFRLGAGEAIAYADGPPRLADGTLAGSALQLDEAVRNTVALGIDPAVALSAATAVPAGAIGDTARGRIEPGCRADLVWWDDDLRVRRVWVAGELV